MSVPLCLVVLLAGVGAWVEGAAVKKVPDFGLGKLVGPTPTAQSLSGISVAL